MEKFKEILKRIFCLPPIWTVVAALLGYGFVIAVAVFRIQNPVLQYASYIASAYALIVTITGFIYINTAIGGIRKFISDHPLMKKFRSTAVGKKYLTELSLTTALLSQFGSSDEGDMAFRKVMTGATGGGVCTIVIGMAIYMIRRANKSLKEIEINNSQT